MKKICQFLLTIILILILPACASGHENGLACRMETRVTIAVTDVTPQVFFDQLSHDLGCEISVSPFVWKHITLDVQNTTGSDVIALVSRQNGIKFVQKNGRNVIQPMTLIDKGRARQWEEFKKMMEERQEIFQSRLPEGMSFTDVPLSTVLDDISKSSGLKLKPWKEEGKQKVTIDLSGMIVEEALKAVVLYVDGEGVVLVEQKYFLHHSWGQIWLWDSPPSF